MIGCLSVVFLIGIWLCFIAIGALLVQWIAATFFAVHISFWIAFFVLWAIRFIVNLLFK